MSSFMNLAGRDDSDQHCLDELEVAGIMGTKGWVPVYGEVKTSVVGLMGTQSFSKEAIDFFSQHETSIDFLIDNASFVLTRAWYYWSVRGFVPEAVAELIHVDPRNRGTVRVAGHCGAPHPAEWLTKRKIAGHHCIDSYHIDTPLGLKVFVDHVTAQALV